MILLLADVNPPRLNGIENGGCDMLEDDFDLADSRERARRLGNKLGPWVSEALKLAVKEEQDGTSISPEVVDLVRHLVKSIAKSEEQDWKPLSEEQDRKPLS